MLKTKNAIFFPLSLLLFCSKSWIIFIVYEWIYTEKYVVIFRFTRLQCVCVVWFYRIFPHIFCFVWYYFRLDCFPFISDINTLQMNSTRVPQSFLFWFGFLLTILRFRMSYVDGCVCLCVWKIFSNTFFAFLRFRINTKIKWKWNENESDDDCNRE